VHGFVWQGKFYVLGRYRYSDLTQHLNDLNSALLLYSKLHYVGLSDDFG
jgi:hypothetical protein